MCNSGQREDAEVAGEEGATGLRPGGRSVALLLPLQSDAIAVCTVTRRAITRVAAWPTLWLRPEATS